MATARSIASNTLVSLVARSLGLAFAFLTLWLVTRYLGLERAGEYFTVLAYVGIANVVADLGLYPIFVREISRPGADEARIAGSMFSLRLLSLVLVLGIAAPSVALFLPYSRTVQTGTLIGGAAFAFLSLGALLVGVFQKYLRMRIVALSELIGRAVQLALVAWAVFSGLGVLAVLGAVFTSALIQFSLMFKGARRLVPFRLSADVAVWKTVLAASYPVALSTVFSFVYFKVDSVMLSLMQPAAAVGIYGLAYKILEVLAALPAILVGIMTPVLTRSLTESRDRFREVFGRIAEILMLTALPLLAGGIVLAPKIARMFGSGFADAARPLVLLLIAVFAIFLGTLFANALIVAEKQKTLAKIYFWGMALNIAANFWTIPRFSYTGAAVITALTEIGVTAAMAYVLARIGVFAFPLRRIPAMVGATVGMAAVLYLLRPHSVFLLLPLGVLLYAIFALLGRAVTMQELRTIAVARNNE